VCVLGTSVFLVVKHAQYCLEYATNKSLKVFSQETGWILCPFTRVLSSFQENDHWDNFSCHYGNMKAHHSSFTNALLKECLISLSVDRLAEPVTQKSGPVSPMEGTPHHTDTPGVITAPFSDM
jgi:hypothetical protein